MKVVLSRKSMDAVYGGLPSPVFTREDGSRHFFPLPIPFKKDYSGVHYNDILLFDDYTAWNFIQDVAPDYRQSEYCHLDPDIRKSYLVNRHTNWQPAFGQLSASQSHLANNNIDSGDVFLFFGWFQFAALVHGKARYIASKDYPNGFHAIYGYLQIGTVCRPRKDAVPPYIAAHPHAQFNTSGSPFSHVSNTLYIAGKHFTYQNKTIGKPGAATFAFKRNLVLTQKGQMRRTTWELPANLHPDNGIELSYNAAPFWKRAGDTTILSAYSRGQEFIFKKDSFGIAENWCVELIKHTGIDG